MLDNTLVFADEQAVTATANAAQVVDTIGGGNEYSKLWLEAVVKEDFATLTGLTFELVESDDKALGSPNTLFSKKVLLSDLKAGATPVKVRLPLFTKRYLGLKFTVDGSEATAGKVSAYLTDAVSTAV